jgi:transposase
MLYMGIDVGKNNHEAGIINPEGKHLGKSLRFTNTSEGYVKLVNFIRDKRSADEPLKIGMEATGHYWLALYSYLFEQGFDISVINPIQSDSLRNFHIRQTKTDSVDSFLIAETNYMKSIGE